MDDEEYARELFAILTRPLDPDEPRDAYGTGADRIDRYGGFGTELVVTSVAAVAGPHGSQLEVGYRLDVPKDHDLPSEGTFLVPLAAEWREAQGYGAPATYAAHVARAAEMAVRERVGSRSSAGRAEPGLPDRDGQAALLLDVFGVEHDVETLAPDRFVLRRDGQAEWTIIVTPDQWEQVVRRHGPRRAWLEEHFSELLAANTSDDSFLVFWEGDLVTSVRAELPPVNGSVRESQRLIQRRPVPGGGWFAYTPGSERDPRA